MVQAVIFDLYGVLALNGWQAFKAKHLTDRPAVWDQVFELGRKVDAGLADYQDLIQYTAQKTGEDQATVRYQLEHTVANEALISFIQSKLKPQYKLGILSNASSNVVDSVLSKDQEALFDAVVLSHHVGLTKPEKGMYEAIADKLGVAIEHCLFIDDQDRHAQGARDAGMQALVYSDLPTLQQDILPYLTQS